MIHYLDARERDPRSRDSGHQPADTADTYRANGALELIIHGLSRLLLPGPRGSFNSQRPLRDGARPPGSVEKEAPRLM